MHILKEPDDFIGTPFDADSFHCWTLVEKCLDVPTLHGISVSRAEENINDNLPYFLERENPLNYCIVMLGKKHVGIYKDGNVYHADRDMVKCQPLRVLSRLYNPIKYYDKVD